ncbi:hypothetical protein [Ruegeria sp. HKCCD7255]|uniref:hypothetical protein n=1 Tax=Ruegeria sp. HKCCD7255 TaxID=2683004 RepID=UPI00148814DD|nr:hypothetical protein [Ruegeria sp. HKCCD7255]
MTKVTQPLWLELTHKNMEFGPSEVWHLHRQYEFLGHFMDVTFLWRFTRAYERIWVAGKAANGRKPEKMQLQYGISYFPGTTD